MNNVLILFMRQLGPNLHGVMVAEAIIGMPADVLSIPPLYCQSTPGNPHPMRQMDILGIPNFFDHSGNSLDGSLAATAIISAGMLIQRYVPESKQRQATISVAAAAGVGSVGINLAYEAGTVNIPFRGYEKEADSPFDSGDALAGSLAGIAFSITYGVAALRHRRKTHERE